MIADTIEALMERVADLESEVRGLRRENAMLIEKITGTAIVVNGGTVSLTCGEIALLLVKGGTVSLGPPDTTTNIGVFTITGDVGVPV